MNFGMTNTPSTFVKLMNAIFRPLIGKLVLSTSTTSLYSANYNSQHELDLRNVIKILQENWLYAKPSKRQFYDKSLMSLGHVISNNRIKPDPENI